MDRIDTLKTLIVLCLASLAGYWAFHAKWLFWVAVILLITGTFENRLAVLIAKCWLKFANFLGSINSRIILTALFYLILTPIALLYKMFNPAFAEYITKRGKQTYFRDIEAQCSKDSFRKLW